MPGLEIPRLLSSERQQRPPAQALAKSRARGGGARTRPTSWTPEGAGTLSRDQPKARTASPHAATRSQSLAAARPPARFAAQLTLDAIAASRHARLNDDPSAQPCPCPARTRTRSRHRRTRRSHAGATLPPPCSPPPRAARDQPAALGALWAPGLPSPNTATARAPLVLALERRAEHRLEGGGGGALDE